MLPRRSGSASRAVVCWPLVISLGLAGGCGSVEPPVDERAAREAPSAEHPPSDPSGVVESPRASESSQPESSRPAGSPESALWEPPPAELDPVPRPEALGTPALSNAARPSWAPRVAYAPQVANKPALLELATATTAEQVLLICEDIGRHNTLDKLWGKAMLGGIDTAGCLLVTTGRVSMEMLGKAAKMGVSVVASRSSPSPGCTPASIS